MGNRLEPEGASQMRQLLKYASRNDMLQLTATKPCNINTISVQPSREDARFFFLSLTRTLKCRYWYSNRQVGKLGFKD